MKNPYIVTYLHNGVTQRIAVVFASSAEDATIKLKTAVGLGYVHDVFASLAYGDVIYIT